MTQIQRFLIVIFFVLALFLLLVPAAMALTIGSGDWVQVKSYNPIDMAGILTFNISHENGGQTFMTYDTFCIQENVNIYLNQWFPVASLSNHVGLYGHNIAGMGTLNGTVDYLFYRYKAGAYDNWLSDQNGKEYQYQADFQKVLWGLQGSGPSYASPGTPWASDLDAYIQTPSMQHSWGTEVINIATNYSNGQFSGPDIQNQLYNQVSEPITLLLLGSALIGVIAVRRRLED